MMIYLINLIFIFLSLLTEESFQIELNVIGEIENFQGDFFHSEVSIKDVSKLAAVKDQLKVFDKSGIDFSINGIFQNESPISNHLKEVLSSGVNNELIMGSNRGAFVIYDTNDYPYACMCNSAQYQNWVNSGSNSTVKVECTNKINTGIFNSNDIDYCDPTNIAASQN